LNITKQQAAKMIAVDRFPLSNKYDSEWVLTNQMGPSALWLTEWLVEKMDLKPGMRVLDMGCGKAMSSIFLAKEYGVKVWANDLWISASENWERICEAGFEDQICPIHAEARSLPYAEGYFDAIVSIDSYQYYGTDDLYLGYFSKYVKPGGQMGIVVPGLAREIEGEVPEHLTRPQSNGLVFWVDDCFCFHTADWWKHFWGRTRLVDVETTDVLEDGIGLWLQFEKAVVAAGTNIFPSAQEVLAQDGGRSLAWVRQIARRKE
jgi:ubiquinone/menaquinone biosynthesis C-methylase UbiE